MWKYVFPYRVTFWDQKMTTLTTLPSDLVPFDGPPPLARVDGYHYPSNDGHRMCICTSQRGITGTWHGGIHHVMSILSPCPWVDLHPTTWLFPVFCGFRIFVFFEKKWNLEKHKFPDFSVKTRNSSFSVSVSIRQNNAFRLYGRLWSTKGVPKVTHIGSRRGPKRVENGSFSLRTLPRARATVYI